MGQPSDDTDRVRDGAERRLAWLDRVGACLEMPADRRVEVLEEIAAHLDDAIDALMEEGLPADQAEREAMARLGSPEALGEQLRTTHQATRRLLASAGGGVWTGLEGLATGWVILSAWVIPLWYLVLAVGAFVGGTSGRDGSGDILMLPVVPLLACGALWLAARRATQAVARASWRREHAVRIPIAAAGLATIGLPILTIPAYQSWPSLLATLAMPFAFAAGAISAGGRPDGSPWIALHWPSRLPSRLKVWWGLVIVCAFVWMAISVGGYPGRSGSSQNGPAQPATPLPAPPENGAVDPPATLWHASGFALVAPTQVAPNRGVVVAGWIAKDGWTLIELATDEVDWSTLPGVQLELWRSSTAYASENPTLVEPQRGPYRVVPVPDPLATPRIAVQTGTPGGIGYVLFVVSIDPVTGARTVVGHPAAGRATFHGTPLDWFAEL